MEPKRRKIVFTLSSRIDRHLVYCYSLSISKTKAILFYMRRHRIKNHYLGKKTSSKIHQKKKHQYGYHNHPLLSYSRSFVLASPAAASAQPMSRPALSQPVTCFGHTQRLMERTRGQPAMKLASGMMAKAQHPRGLWLRRASRETG